MKKLLWVLVLLWPMGASAGFFTGKDLQKYCFGTANDPAKYNVCLGYLASASDTAKVLADWGYKDKNNGGPIGSCIADSVTMEQARQAWLLHARQYPQQLHQAAASLVLNAFELAWPCKR